MEFAARRIAPFAAIGFLAFAIALTWPLGSSVGSTIPLGTEKVSTVPALNAWTVWWNANRFGFGFTGYWDAPIFYPAEYAFAFSESQPTTLAVALLVRFAGPPLAYNVYLLTVLTLNGLLSFHLLRRVGLAILPSLLGGVMVESLPIVHWQLGVLQLTTLCGVVWLIARLVALREHPTLMTSILLGLAAALCYMACNYFGLFLSVLLPLSAPILLWGRWLDWRFWLFLFASGLLAGVLCSPILWAQVRAKESYDWKRDEALLVSLSAHPEDYLNTPWKPLFHERIEGNAERKLWSLGPGVAKLFLAVVGVAAGLSLRNRRRWTLFLIAFTSFAFLLSLGPVPDFGFGIDASQVDDWWPYRLLMSFHPGLKLARSPFRFAFFVQLGVALLAVNTLDLLWRGISSLVGRWPQASSWNLRLASLITALVGIYAACEVVPAPAKLWTPPSLEQEWINWLQANGHPQLPILCLPFPKGASVGDYERTASFMYEQTGHRRPMVGGYSGFFPAQFLALKESMANFPKPAVLEELRTRNVEFVVTAEQRLTELAERSPGLRLVFQDEIAKVSIFRVLPSVEVDYERFFSP